MVWRCWEKICNHWWLIPDKKVPDVPMRFLHVLDPKSPWIINEHQYNFDLIKWTPFLVFPDSSCNAVGTIWCMTCEALVFIVILWMSPLLLDCFISFLFFFDQSILWFYDCVDTIKMFFICKKTWHPYYDFRTNITAFCWFMEIYNKSVLANLIKHFKHVK